VDDEVADEQHCLQTVAKFLSNDEARRIAANTAKLPEVFRLVERPVLSTHMANIGIALLRRYRC